MKFCIKKTNQIDWLLYVMLFVVQNVCSNPIVLRNIHDELKIVTLSNAGIRFYNNEWHMK
jgi:hypothetical protein